MEALNLSQVQPLRRLTRHATRRIEFKHPYNLCISFFLFSLIGGVHRPFRRLLRRRPAQRGYCSQEAGAITRVDIQYVLNVSTLKIGSMHATM